MRWEVVANPEEMCERHVSPVIKQHLDIGRNGPLKQVTEVTQPAG
jgi:hypothetical protein